MEQTTEKAWHERDDFWETVHPILFPAKRISAAGEEVEQVMSLLDLQAGLSICDLCCGVGRHSLELARRGFQVTGVDRTDLYLQEAQNKAKKEGLDIEFVKDDMRTFCRPDSFDVVINMYTSFGYFGDPSDDRRVLENVYTSLKSNGKLLLELMGKEILARVFRERDWREENGVVILEEGKIGKNWGSVENRWIMLKDGKTYEGRFSHRLYCAVGLCDLLKDCGFGRVDVYGDLSGSAYDQKAKRLVVVAHKQKEEAARG